MTEVATAFVRLRVDASQVRPEMTSAVRKDIQATERQFGSFGRGALYGSGALRTFGRAALYGSSTLIGGAGLVFAIRKTIAATRDAQLQQALLVNAVRSSGLSYRIYAGEIKQAITATSQLGFSQDETTQSYATLIRATKNVTTATRDQTLAANIARATGKSLQQATIAVAQAEAGRATGLSRLVPGITKGAHAELALAEATQKTAGAASKYTHTFAGEQDTLNAAITRTEVTIGTALLPTLGRLAGGLSDWLGKSKSQQRIQQDVNQAVKDGTEIVHGLADGLHAVEVVGGPVVRVLGGVKGTVELLIALKAYAWARNFAIGLGLIGPAAVRAGAGIAAADAAIGGGAAAGSLAFIGRGAIGSRVGIAASAAVATERVGLLRAGLLGLSRIGPLALGVTLYVATKYLPQGKNIHNPLRGFPIADKVFGFGARVGQSIFGTPNNGGFGTAAALAAAARHPGRWVDASGRPVNEDGTPINPALVSTPFAPGFRGLTPNVGAPKLPIVAVGERQRLRLAVATAQGTKSTADDLKALTDQRIFLAKQIKAETARLATATSAKQAAKFYDNLLALQNEDNSAIAQIASIEDQATADAKAKAARIAAAAKKAADARKKLIALALDSAKKAGVLADTARATALSIQEGALTIARQAADLAAARAGTNAALIAKATKLQERADERLIAFYKDRIAKTRGLARQGYQQQLLSAQIDLAGLKKSGASQSFTLAELYREAESEFKVYGSNYGPRGTALSPQDVRGQYSAITLKHKGSVHVTQVFMGQKSPSQAMNDARAGARYLN